MASTVLMQAPGYLLYLPPTSIKSRFVMVEEAAAGNHLEMGGIADRPAQIGKSEAAETL